MSKHMKRMWINQPSTLQPYHHHHGENVLADVDNEIVYFLHGAVISMRVPWVLWNVLANGWKQ